MQIPLSQILLLAALCGMLDTALGAPCRRDGKCSRETLARRDAEPALIPRRFGGGAAGNNAGGNNGGGRSSTIVTPPSRSDSRPAYPAQIDGNFRPTPDSPPPVVWPAEGSVNNVSPSVPVQPHDPVPNSVDGSSPSLVIRNQDVEEPAQEVSREASTMPLGNH